MSAKWLRRMGLLVLAVASLVGCGGGGGANTQVAGGGIGGTGVAFGSITQFGSIFVNGVEYGTGGATILKDDDAILESELRLGMTVEVRGSIDSSTSGSATEVRVEEAVRGPVESVGTDSLMVLGQTVLIDNTTRFDNNVPDLASIHAGNLVEVHGLIKAAGTIAATYVERSTATIFVVRGFITGHNAATQSFGIGALTVGYDGAMLDDMPAPSGSNWNGLFVEVKGSVCAGSPTCGTLAATKVEPEGLKVADADEAEVEGFVTAVVSATQFMLGNQSVVTNGSTVFAGGTAADIAVGVKLEVEGPLVGGVITATKVSFRDNVRIESDADVVDAVGGALTLKGLPGITVSVNGQTEFKGGANSLADISGHVRIRGRASGATTVVATEVEKRSPDTTVILQGPVQAAMNPTLTILGVAVDTTGFSTDGFKDVNNNPIGETAFFNALTIGSLVKTKGALAGSIALWDEVELEE